MALIEFEDLPSTNTPLTASNLNNNFGELDTRLTDTETNVDSFMNRTFSSEALTAVSGTLSPSAWREIVSTKQITIDAGTYLFVFRGSVSGSTSSQGIGTLRPTVNGSEVARQTFPIGNIFVNAAVPVFQTFATDQTITVGLQVYPTVSISSNGGVVYWYKLN